MDIKTDIGEILEEVEHLKEELTFLRRLTFSLKRGDCWCEIGIGDPRLSSHSVYCSRLSSYFKRIESEQARIQPEV